MIGIFCCVSLAAVGAGVLAIRHAWRPARYEARHTGPQPAVREHAGATEDWSPTGEMAKVPPRPLMGDVDPRILLAEAEAEATRALSRVAELRRVVQAAEDNRLHDTLERLGRSFKEQLARAGQADTPTAEWAARDIRRMVHRAGAR